MNKSALRSLAFYGALILVFLFAMQYISHSNDAGKLSYSQMVQLFQQEQVKSFTVQDNTVTLDLSDGSEDRCEITDVTLFREDLGELIQQQWTSGVITDYSYEPDTPPSWISTWGPSLLTCVVIVAMIYLVFLRQNAGGGKNSMANFGKAHTSTPYDKDHPVTFRDVAGAEEEKEELKEIVDFLRDPQKYNDLGARIPKGVLLVGPPGTGKTLLAKAVAGEAGVEFLSISGSDFVEMYVGVGASRVRDLFEQAKKTAPSIVFIDEIDAVGRQRGTGLGGGHDEREQTLNQLLVEMDGFSGNSGVIVMAATNRQDILDPALLRPGRFDRQIYVGYPDVKGREEILGVHSRRKPLAEDVDLHTLAKSTGGFTGADLENLMNEGALRAARDERHFISMDDLQESIIKVIAGPAKKSRVVTESSRRLTAWHEAGHAVVMHTLPTHDPVHQITIVPRGQAGGMTISLPEEDKPFRSRTELYEDIVALLGGRCAEALVLGDISTGASNDLQRANSIARNMVTKYGMSEKLGPLVLDTGNDEVFIGRSMGHTHTYSETIASGVDQEVRAILDRAMAECTRRLEEHRRELGIVANFLLEHETMSAEEFETVFTQPDAAKESQSTSEI
ncbi:MAG: ATP-dependent zinc metalloprotease FtsH [Oscillospiraceae bacterium]|nr:ATP-dependent zinc metalloprotease FtsH [Eubacteriales bacterium]MDY2617975.1 ATP-dependent zinc metalloprotease FtsH [Oscillospiraceae bacterium]